MNINTISDLYDEVDKVEYGWYDKNGMKHYKLNMMDYQENYILQSPGEVIEHKIGVCWDQVELERYYLEKMNIKCNSYLIYYDGERKDRAHTFLIYEKDNKYYWFEHAWSKYKGIHEYNSINDIFKRINYIFTTEEIKEEYSQNKISIYKYDKPNYHIGHYEFLRHCRHGIKQIIDLN